MNFKERYGLIRSWFIYYAKPFNKKKLKNFYSQFITTNDLVFDIGAHLGNRSAAFLSLGAKVIAVEPQPNCIRFVNNKFSNDHNLTLLPILVGKDEEELDFHINYLSPTISTVRDKDWQQSINSYSLFKPKWNQTILIRSTTLDSLIKKYGLPVFCKIDTEGFEYEVLSGLNHPINCISIEYLAFDSDRILQCFNKIGSLGNYKINFSPGESQKWLWDKWKNAEEVKDILSTNSLGYRFGDFYFKRG